MYKCYVLLFTRCVTRAVHLELSTDFNSNSVMLALCRFISRRGITRLFISDNFKSFKLVAVKIFCNTREIVCKFILDRSLKKVLWKTCLTPFHLIFGKSFNVKCEIDFNVKVKSDDLRVQVKHTEIVLKHFNNRFYKEYMSPLLEQYSFQTKRNSNNQAKMRIGEIVIIKDDKPRIL